MITVRGILKPNPKYQGHNHATFTIPAAGREFAVDTTATRDVDEDGKPLRLTRETWADLEVKIADGTVTCTPLGFEGDAGAELRRAVEEIDKRGKRIKGMKGELDALVDQLRQRDANIETLTTKHAGEVADLQLRIGELDAQLMAAKALAPVLPSDVPTDPSQSTSGSTSASRTTRK